MNNQVNNNSNNRLKGNDACSGFVRKNSTMPPLLTLVLMSSVCFEATATIKTAPAPTPAVKVETVDIDAADIQSSDKDSLDGLLGQIIDYKVNYNCNPSINTSTIKRKKILSESCCHRQERDGSINKFFCPVD